MCGKIQAGGIKFIHAARLPLSLKGEGRLLLDRIKIFLKSPVIPNLIWYPANDERDSVHTVLQMEKHLDATAPLYLLNSKSSLE